jgi:hypothetical protein
MNTYRPVLTDEYWDFFIADCIRLGSPLYAGISEGTRRDRELCALAEVAQDGQPPANMLLGAVHYLLLRGADHPLRKYYPSVGGGETEGDPFPLFRDFCLAHRNAIAELMRTRVTNTNEVRRCVYLLPGFLTIAADAPLPLHLIEIGPSAGINLNWDKYGYRYQENGAAHEAGVVGADLVLETDIVGRMPPLGAPPPVGKKAGIELHPVDLTKAEDRDWLRALVWPDRPERMARLEQALAVSAKDPPDIRAGDVLDLLLDVAAEMPRHGALCIFHTMTTYQFSAEQKATLADLMLLISLRRPVWRLWMEYTDGTFSLFLTRYADGAETTQLLAHGTGHATQIDWQA